MMKSFSIFLFNFLFCTMVLYAHESLKFLDEIPAEFIAGPVINGGKPAEEDPNINASAATLEAGPSAIVAGCVNVMTGSFFDSGIDLILPGPQPLIVQHTFCNFFSCHFSHKPSLEVGPSKHGHYLHALYTDDNGSGIPFKGAIEENELKDGFLRITEEARNHLTNYSGSEISGRTRWANSSMRFVRKEEEKFYYLTLGSGAKRIFERYERTGKKHQPGVPFGKFRLKEERSPNGNKYLYSYRGDDNLYSVKAINKHGTVLADLKCAEGHFSLAHYRTVFSLGNKSVTYDQYLGKNSTLIMEPSHGIPIRYTYESVLSLKKYQFDKSVLNARFALSSFAPGPEHSHIFVTTLLAPVGETEELIPIYHFTYRMKDHSGCTIVRDALDRRVEYRYSSKNKRLYGIETYENERICRREKFYWHKPKNPHKIFPLKNLNQLIEHKAHTPSEHLLLSHALQGDGIRHFCRHFEYDPFGNITKNHLWGNLTGLNTQPIVLKDGIPIDNGCEVYTKVMQSSQDGLNLPLYEEDGRKWIRQSYYPKTNLLQKRLTGAGESILKREFFRYDHNAVLIEEIWDNGCLEDKNELKGVTERHIRITTPRKEFPIGLPQIVQEYYYDSETDSNQLIKKLINEHSPEGKILSQQHYGSDGLPKFTLFWKYDHLGNVIEETNAMGETITREFDAYSNKRKESGPRPDVYTLFDYDHSHRLFKEEEVWADGQRFVTHHRYNLLNQKIATTDPKGQETLFFYDRLGHQTKIVHPAIYTVSGEMINPSSETHYNAMGQAIAIRDANAHWTKKEYTIRGQVCKIHYPDGSHEQKEYSLDGLLVKEIAKNGLITRYTYDPLGRQILTEKYSPEEILLSKRSATYSTFQLLTETDEAGLVTGYQYDGAGRLQSTTKKNKVTTYAYDALGRRISETEGGVTVAKEYDLLDRVVEDRIEANGEIVTIKQYKYDSNGNRTNEITYSQAGIATKITTYNPHNEPIQTKDALGNTTHFSYDKIDYKGQTVDRTIFTDPLGNQEIKIFDTHNQVKELYRLNPFGHLIQSESYFYDAAGQKLQSVSQVYNETTYARTIITEWAYDCMGNMIHCIEAKGTPEQKNTHLVYNLTGQKEQIIQPNGTILFHEYDFFGRLQRFTSSDKSLDYTYTYDVKDNLLEVADKIHGTSNPRSYDEHNNLISETLDTGLTLSYTYDELDRPLTIVLPDQSAIHYNYTGHYLRSIDRIKDNQIAYTHYYKEYDQAENLLNVGLPGKAGVIEFKYDLLQRLISQKAPHWLEIVPENGYDAVGNLLKRQVVDIQGKIDYTYTYDDLYQLSSEQGHAAHTYANDSLYNRIAKNDQPYTVNGLNQLLNQTNCSYLYDANGNLTSIKQDEEHTTFCYDALDRLIQVKKGEKVVHYRYDSFHRRLSKINEGIPTNYLYLKDNEIGAVVDQVTKELRILGLGKGAEIGAAVAIELEDKAYVPIHDPYGNVVTILDINGNIATSYRYTAFGEEETNGNSSNAWRYSSKRVDPETGYIYFGRRYYMPSIGRWLTPDPLWYADGPNLYAYVHNRPLTSIDPDGQFAFLIPLVLSLALDYCIPTIVAGLTEYAVAGGIAASVVSGFASGYSDPLSSALDPGTYSIGDADITSFICNRAGMLIGAAVACKPTNAAASGVKSVANVAGREIAGAVITKAEVAITKTVTAGMMKQGAKTTAQKTAQVAEQYVAKRGTPSLDALSKAGQVMDRNGMTKAGRALQKHSSRSKSVFPKTCSKATDFNKHGQFHLDDILTHPKTIFKPNKYGGWSCQIPGGKGARFNADTEFMGFLQP